VPKNPEVIKAWIDANKKSTEAEKAELAKRTIEEVNADEEEKVDKTWTTFKSDSVGLYIESRQIKAMLKETANTLQIDRGTGSVAKKQTLQHGTFITPERIHLRDATGIHPIREPTGVQERPVHVISFRGPRVALKREDYVENAVIAFQIEVAIPRGHDKPVVTTPDFTDMLELGQKNGIGASRTQENGKFKLLEFTEVEKTRPGGEPPQEAWRENELKVLQKALGTKP